MPKLGKNYLILIITLCIVGFLSILINVSRLKPPTNVDLGKVPLTVGGWYGKGIPVEENVSAILETESILMREYKKGDDIIWLAIVYYKDSRVALHLPESCYTGQGSQIIERGVEKVNDKISANRFTLKGDKGDQIILYYFASGDFITYKYQALRWHMMLNKIKNKSNSGALVRFSISYNEQNRESQLGKLKGFINEITPVISKFLI